MVLFCMSMENIDKSVARYFIYMWVYIINHLI